MKLPTVKKEKLERALKLFDEKFRHRPKWKDWMDNQAQRYAISANNQLYPPKKIVSLATGTPVGDFSGGKPTNGYLERHGFMIVDLPRTSEPELRFVIGQVYDRQTEIHKLFGGSHRNGISASARSPAIFIFTGNSGEQYGYTDTRDENGVFAYTGEGQTGDMTLTNGNLAILEHAVKGKALHLFESLGKSQGQRYLGEFYCANHEWGRGPDKKGNDRKVVIFNLFPMGLEIDLQYIADDEEDDDDLDPSMTLAEARRLALAAAKAGASAGKGSALRTVYRRSKRIADYVLKRALGKCESCNEDAPFKKKNGSPYLEPHHINRLSDGGLDHPRYIGAICPTCHREIHHGENGHKKNEKLKAHIFSIEPQS
ncbi:HNH endonuclease [Pseudomonas sp. FW305-70]|uniref:HNH endonuclease n=1 Tax=Pseudomonas sp. FW305-70 TaxID=2751342 RepID=UPI000C883D5C|nr:HNH endonuclease signature motif containing protein [Pseudomonas sp. FW305-70]PMZ74887.1 HNH endonuclease [Pseudomonas sp. FW305-70]